MTLYEERIRKVERIVEEYAKRKTQQEVAGMFGMSVDEVGDITRLYDYKHTRKVSQDNIRKGESISPLISVDELKFLDNYPIQNFQ